jgi:hypothetical protein
MMIAGLKIPASTAKDKMQIISVNGLRHFGRFRSVRSVSDFALDVQQEIDSKLKPHFPALHQVKKT